MSASIEWGDARRAATYVVGHDDEAGDNMTPHEAGREDPAAVGLMFEAGGDGYCLVGTPAELIRVLTTALDQVAERITDEDRIASEEAKR